MTTWQVFLIYFGLPAGAVWSNLIASVICVGVAYVKLTVENRRRHRAAMAEHAAIRQVAENAHQIAADLYKHHTGTDHELSPTTLAR